MSSTVVESLEGEHAKQGPTREVVGVTGAAVPLQTRNASAQSLARMGVRLCMLERYKESIEALRGALAIAPYDLSILNNLAVVYERAADTAQAIRVVEQSLALSHAQQDSWIYLGNLKRTTGDLAGAHAAYESAISLEVVAPLAWQGLGSIKQAQRKPLEAIQCFITCIKQSQATPPLLAILGQLFYESGQFEKSRDAYALALEGEPQNSMYLQMHRETRFMCAAIAGETLTTAIEVFEQECAASPGAQDKSTRELLQTTFALLSAHGLHEAARRVGAVRVSMFPDSASAAYLLKAVSGDTSLARSPDAYLIECFDEFADRFDDHLIHTLGYDIPQKLARALGEWVPARAKREVLDAGCGTGLCGPCVRGIAASLTGVDLSPRMLERARQRHVYDHLVCQEITAYLMELPARYDVVVAADVMIYFGDLAPLSHALAHALKPGGLLAFSTESATGGHKLLSSGRFAHGLDYVQSVFASQFQARTSHETTIRLEATRAVAGNLFIFQRR